MNKTKITALAAALAAGFAACKKDTEDPPAPAPVGTPSNIQINLGFHWGDPEFELGETYADGAGNAIVFTAVKFFISDVHLINGGTPIAHFHDGFILATAEEEATYTIGTLNSGSFDSVELTLGLDSAVNHADPAGAEPPLDDASMHTGTTAEGYNFLVLEGRVDDDGNGIVDVDDPQFIYHCSTDDALREIEGPHSATIVGGQNTWMHVHLNVQEIVNGLDMLATPTASGYDPINVQLMDNLVTGMEIE